MMPTVQAYNVSDWIVHRHYGVGQIESVEEKSIGDNKNTYYKIQGENSTFWVPLDKSDDAWLRPVVEPAEMEEAVEVLRTYEGTIEGNLSQRQSRVRRVSPNDSPVEIALLLRDLRTLRSKNKNLSRVEENALRLYTTCFTTEWSVSLQMNINEVRALFDNILRNPNLAPNI